MSSDPKQIILKTDKLKFGDLNLSLANNHYIGTFPFKLPIGPDTITRVLNRPITIGVPRPFSSNIRSLCSFP